MATEDVQPAQRRIIMRRSRSGGGGFSPSSSTRSESLRTSDHDEVDDAIEPESIDDDIRSGRVALPTAPRPRDNARDRLNAVQAAGSMTYGREYRMVLLNRMLMRGVPLDQIARELQVSISTVEKDRAELKKHLRAQATQLNIDEMVGGQNAFYDEVRGMAMRVAGAPSTGDGAVPTPMKLAALRTSLAAEADRTRFMSTAGVYDVLRFRRAEDGGSVSDVQSLMQQTLELMQRLDEPEDLPGDPPAKKSKPAKAGFKAMSFDDTDSSSGTNEIQEL